MHASTCTHTCLALQQVGGHDEKVRALEEQLSEALRNVNLGTEDIADSGEAKGARSGGGSGSWKGRDGSMKRT